MKNYENVRKCMKLYEKTFPNTCLSPNLMKDHRFPELKIIKKSKNANCVVTFLPQNPKEDHRFAEPENKRQSKKRNFYGHIFDPKPYRRPSIY